MKATAGTTLTAESLRRKMTATGEPAALDAPLTHTALLLKRKQVLRTLDFNCRGISQSAVDSISSGTSVEVAANMAIAVFADLMARSGIASKSLDERLAIETFQRTMLKAIGQFDEFKSSGNGEVS